MFNEIESNGYKIKDVKHKIKDVKDVIASILLVDDLRIQKN